jgi:AAHS family 4-hydroxybenzoate transporter-like MFS transporter
MHARQVVVLSLCFLLNLLDGLDIIAMSVSAPLIAREQALPPETTGYILSAALLGMTLGAIFLSPLADILGRAKIVAGAAALAGLAMILTSQSGTNLSLIIASRVITGLGVGIIMSCTTAIATENASDKLRHVLVPLVIAGYPVGAIIVSLIAPAILNSFGWPALFFGGGVASLISALLVIIFIPETLPAASETSKRFGFLEILTARYWTRNLRLWTLFFAGLTTMYLLMSWIPYLFTVSGFSATEGAYALSLLNLGGVAGIMTMSLLTLRIRLPLLVISALMLALFGMVAFNLLSGQDITINYAIIALIGFSFQSGYNGLYAIAASSYPTTMRATGVGLAIGIGRFGAVAAPIFGGYLIGGGWSMGQIVVLLSLPVGLMVVLVSLHERSAPIQINHDS